MKSTTLALCTTTTGTRARVRVRMSYTASDPYAVTWTFQTTPVAVQWVIGRELLLAGVTSRTPVGDGDVQLHRGDQGGLEVRLSSPSGESTFTMSGSDVVEFLADTLAEVPEGFEVVGIDDVATLLTGPTRAAERRIDQR